MMTTLPKLKNDNHEVNGNDAKDDNGGYNAPWGRCKKSGQLSQIIFILWLILSLINWSFSNISKHPLAHLDGIEYFGVSFFSSEN